MIVVADTSVLLNLSRIGQVELLLRLFREVVVPETVAGEFRRLARATPRFQGLILPEWVCVRSETAAVPEVRTSGLDPGEVAAIELALAIRADALLVDERRGQAVAKRLGLRTIGVLGILLQAKRSGLVPRMVTLLDALEVEAQFWISAELRQRVLELAGE
ncbi:MAG: DUF3368 domain-containing protein [Verrucomicrobia bacterium]|nr:DUF3368 domain-containing protein [Verrucomicrobiota bacterium]